MATWSLAENPNPAALFPGVEAFGQQNGYQLNGDARQGTFAGNVFLIGRVTVHNLVDGARVLIQVDQDLPSNLVAEQLRRVGLHVIQSR